MKDFETTMILGLFQIKTTTKIEEFENLPKYKEGKVIKLVKTALQQVNLT